jgi:hypothetical protein
LYGRIVTTSALLALLGLSVAPAFAAKGGGSTITLVQLTAPTSSTAGPSYGQAVTFDVSSNRTDQPWVHLDCYQDGSLVSSESHPMYQPNPTNDPGTFTLGGSLAWTGGTADCTATLVGYSQNWKEQALAATSFHVSG